MAFLGRSLALRAMAVAVVVACVFFGLSLESIVFLPDLQDYVPDLQDYVPDLQDYITFSREFSSEMSPFCCGPGVFRISHRKSMH